MKTSVSKVLIDPDLGKVQDRIIAKKYGLSISKVSAIRYKLKIPASHIHPLQFSLRKFNWDKIICKLGIVRDIELSKEAGVSRERIRQIRKKHNIPKYKPLINRTEV